MEMIRMKEEKKETKTYRFEVEVIKHAEENPLIPSFAEWCCDRYRKEFMEVETLARKMQTYFNMGNDCKARVAELKKEIEKGSDLNNIKPNELIWIKNEAQKRIKKGTFEGVYKYFVNTFNRPDINRRQFRLMTDRFKIQDPGQNRTK